MRSSSSRGNSPLAAPSLPIPVPLITPRYQRKTRTKNAMTIIPAQQQQQSEKNSNTDASSSTSTSPTLPTPTTEIPVPEKMQQVSKILQQRSEDALHIKHGQAEYAERVQFHTYELFRHGKHQVQSRSVGYSSDGDLVLYKEEYALVSDSDLEVTRAGASMDGAVCLNPTARRPLTDVEAALEPKKIKGPKFRKYPGVRCPKNRKTRNRLQNDHFANDIARGIYNACVENADVDAMLEEYEGERPTFPELTRSVADLVLHVDEDRERRELEKRGVFITPPMHPAPNPVTVDVNHGDYRFQQLNAKLKDELKGALTSEFLTQQIIDLESYFTDYIKHPPKDDQPMMFQFRDGYGRLVCHGVAAYYNLVSRSETDVNGTRLTVVSLPKRTPVELPTSTLLQTLYRRQGRSPVMSGAPSSLLPPFDLDDPVVYSEKQVDAALLQSKPEISATQKKKLRKSMKQLAEHLREEEEGDSAAAGLRRTQTGRGRGQRRSS